MGACRGVDYTRADPTPVDFACAATAKGAPNHRTEPGAGRGGRYSRHPRSVKIRSLNRRADDGRNGVVNRNTVSANQAMKIHRRQARLARPIDLATLTGPFKILAVIVSVVLMAQPGAAAARMYQWKQPGSGTVQLSGSAPGWYRSGQSGPRVLVFDNGVLVDDTAIAVVEEQQRALRAAAFGANSATEDTRDPRHNAVGDGAQANPDSLIDVAAGEESNATNSPADGAAAGPVQATVEELKALIEAWDKEQLKSARSLLERGAPN